MDLKIETERLIINEICSNNRFTFKENEDFRTKRTSKLKLKAENL